MILKIIPIIFLAVSFFCLHPLIGTDTTSLLPLIQKPQTIEVFLTGDIMLNRGVDFYIRQQNDWSWPFLKISDYLSSADLVFGNLESMISDQGVKVGSIYSFRANPQAMVGLQEAGFDILSVANNHSFDYGRLAFEDNLNRLKEANINYVGGGMSWTEAHNPVIKDINGTLIAFLGYTMVGSSAWQAQDNAPGIAWVSLDHLEILTEDIAKAQQESDVLIVSFHFGEEYEKTPNENQKTIAQTAIDSGANLVVGHHPHVLQPIEKYQNGWIAYSLGNFIFDQSFSEETMHAAILKIIIEDKKISQAVMIPTALTNKYQVYLPSD